MTDTPPNGPSPAAEPAPAAEAPQAPYNPWGPGPQFTAKPPRTLTWHAWWAIPLIGLILLGVTRPWEGASAVVFSMKAPAWATAPSPKAAASAPKPGAVMPVQVLSQPAPAAASAPR